VNAPINIESRRRAFAVLPVREQLAAIIGTRAERIFAIDRNSADQAAQTVWMSLASARPYER